MFRKTQNKSGDHENNRKKICLMCLRVTTYATRNAFLPLIGKLKDKVNEVFQYNVCDNDYLPNAICSGCKRKLYRDQIIELPDITQFTKIIRTRSNRDSICKCKLCEMTITKPSHSPRRIAITKPKQNLLQNSSTTNNDAKTTIRKICVQCFTMVDTENHDCNPSIRQKSILSLSQINFKERDRLIAFLLKEKILESGQSTKQFETSLSQCHGKPLRIVVNSNSEKILNEPIISADVMKMIMVNFNFTQNTTIGVASMIRMATRKRKIIEPNVKKYLSAAIHSVDRFFQAKEFDFEDVKDKLTTNTKKTAIFCRDVAVFIEYVKSERQVSNPHLKIGFDGGGGFLKICLSMQSMDDDSSDRIRQKYKDGVCAKRFRDSGVKKLFILAIAESTQENYHNVAVLWYSLKLDQFQGTITVDLKLANIMCGIMSHASTFPCTWCFAQKDVLAQPGELRTIGNILENYFDWQNSGAVKRTAKNYMNCVQRPIFSNDPETLILDIVTPPELHLMLGVVNKVYNHMRAEFESTIDAWTQHCHVERDVTRGSGFNGNSCKTLLNKLDYLRATCPVGCLKYVRILDDFHAVVKSCFGKNLDPNFGDYINNFRESYLDVGISVSPKIHAVFYHVKEFCLKNAQSLGFYSEQAFEAVHYDFNIVWCKYKVKTSHPEYSHRLLKAISEYNGLHI